jgi:preprotein translocase subunit SecB
MELKQQNSLIFKGVDIISTNFTAEKASDGEEALELNVNCGVSYDPDGLSFAILMSAEIKSIDYFKLEVSAVGHFKAKKKIDLDYKNEFINTNAPAIMFPYVRSFISTFSANCGKSLKQITLPTQFFKGELNEIVNP